MPATSKVVPLIGMCCPSGAPRDQFLLHPTFCRQILHRPHLAHIRRHHHHNGHSQIAKQRKCWQTAIARCQKALLRLSGSHLVHETGLPHETARPAAAIRLGTTRRIWKGVWRVTGATDSGHKWKRSWSRGHSLYIVVGFRKSFTKLTEF